LSLSFRFSDQNIACSVCSSHLHELCHIFQGCIRHATTAQHSNRAWAYSTEHTQWFNVGRLSISSGAHPASRSSFLGPKGAGARSWPLTSI
jgi:hypothetical protein